MISIKPNSELDPIAKKYVWWESKRWAYEHPEVFLSNVMNLGHWDDICIVRNVLGDEVLRDVLRNAPPGYFSYRGWDYWHIKLGFDKIPPLPKRDFS